MSRKDYVLIASVLRESWNATDAGSDARATVSAIIVDMSRELAADNVGRFNPDLFVAECTRLD